MIASYALYWFLQASRFGRYSGSGTTSLDEDLRDIGESDSLRSAVERLIKRFNHIQPLESEDFLRDYSDTRFGRFLLYLLAYRNKALDWDKSSQRIGFEGVELLADYRPQWHHIFPKKYLEGTVSDDKIDALANIAVIGPTINIRISAKSPMSYILKYGITKEKLSQQFVTGDIESMSVDNYMKWLNERASRLVEAGNEFLSELRGIVMSRPKKSLFAKPARAPRAARTTIATPVTAHKHAKEKRVNIPTEELRGFVADEEKQPKTLLYPRDPSLDPQLVWKGKDEQDAHDLAVQVVPVYVQEKIQPQAIIENIRAEAKQDAPAQMQMFSDFNGLAFEDLVDFYHHEQKWTNRMILGDPLLVMSSLAEKEGLKGKVQMIYIDPPYGIKFGSNWQVTTRNVI